MSLAINLIFPSKMNDHIILNWIESFVKYVRYSKGKYERIMGSFKGWNGSFWMYTFRLGQKY